MALLSSPWKIVTSTPPTTRAFTFIVLLFSALHAYLVTLKSDATTPNDGLSSPYIPYLTLVPGSSLWFPWTLLTAAFTETSIIELILSLTLLPLSLRYLERLWGAVETIRFILITVFVSNLLGLGLNWIEFLALGNAPLWLYGTNYHGQMALQAAVLVALTQLIPEHQVQFFRSVAIRVKRLPMLYVTLANIFIIIGYQSPFILIQFGWFVSWVYLRFYKRNPESDTWGDRSETFAFVSWFPPFLHYPIGLLSITVYSICLKLHVVRPFSSSSDLELGGYSALPGSARAEAERRRAMALKALDQRLATSSPAPGPIPSRPAQAGPSSMPADPSTGTRATLGEVPVDGGKGKGKDVST